MGHLHVVARSKGSLSVQWVPWSFDCAIFTNISGRYDRLGISLINKLLVFDEILEQIFLGIIFLPVYSRDRLNGGLTER